MQSQKLVVVVEILNWATNRNVEAWCLQAGHMVNIRFLIGFISCDRSLITIFETGVRFLRIDKNIIRNKEHLNLDWFNIKKISLIDL